MSSIDGASIKSASIDGCDSSESGPRAKRPRRGPAPRIFGPLQLFLFIQTPGGWYQQLPASDNVDSSRASGLVAVGIGSWELVKTSGVAERLSPSLSTLADFVVRRTDVESRALLVYKVQSLVTLDEPEAVGAGTLGEQLTRSLNKCASFVDSAHGNVFSRGTPIAFGSSWTLGCIAWRYYHIANASLRLQQWANGEDCRRLGTCSRSCNWPTHQVQEVAA